MAYRNLEQTLEQQRISLKAEQRALEAELARRAAVSKRQTEVAAKLERIEVALAEVAQKRHLRVLDRISVASPCNARWDEMQGDERVRFCRQCSKHVYNLSAMNAEEVVALVYLKEGELCARFYRRPDGTLLTSDCPDGTRKRRRRLVLFAAAAATVAGACATQFPDESEGRFEMGAPTVGSL